MALQDQPLRPTAVLPVDKDGYRADHLLVAQMVEPGSKVLDVGCGEGDLLRLLETRGVDGRGIELSQEGVNHCLARGLSVIQGDADTDLADYPDQSFDYAILSQTLQTCRAPDKVLRDLLRIGGRAFVSFPNFAHWRVRLSLLWGGRMPVTRLLPERWYDTPNIHHLTIDDFRAHLAEQGIVTEGAWFLSRGRKTTSAAANMLAEHAVFLLRGTAGDSGSLHRK